MRTRQARRMTPHSPAEAPPAGGRNASGDELRSLELVPLPARVVGPGRRERDYLKRVAALEDLLQFERERHAGLQRELDLTLRVERGAQRRLDRLEQRLELSHARERRLAALMGALQRDNELLRLKVGELEAAAAARLPASTEPAPRGFWARLLGGSREPPRSRRTRA